MPYPNRLTLTADHGAPETTSAGALSGDGASDRRPEPSSPVLSISPTLLDVTPGGRAEARLSVHNGAGIVDRYRLEVLGPAAEWATVVPDQVSLFPNKTAAATVAFHPPGDRPPLAQSLAFAVKATPVDDPTNSTVEEGSVTVGHLRRLSAELLPLTSQGKRRGRHRLWISNNGNVPLPISVSGLDPDGLLRVTGRPAQLVAAPNSAQRSPVPRPCPALLPHRGGQDPPLQRHRRRRGHPRRRHPGHAAPAAAAQPVAPGGAGRAGRTGAAGLLPAAARHRLGRYGHVKGPPFRGRGQAWPAGAPGPGRTSGRGGPPRPSGPPRRTGRPRRNRCQRNHRREGCGRRPGGGGPDPTDRPAARYWS